MGSEPVCRQRAVELPPQCAPLGVVLPTMCCPALLPTQRAHRLAVWTISTAEEAPGFVAVTPVRWPAGGPRTPGGAPPPVSPVLAGPVPTAQGGAGGMHTGALAQMLATPPAAGRAGGGATTYKK